MLLETERYLVVEYGKSMLASGLVKGSGGNISLCSEDKKLIALTPTGVPYDQMLAEDVVVLDLDGNHVDGDKLPSSEIAFHLGLANLRSDIYSVVHTHSIHATTVACLGLELPPIHYLVGHAGGKVPLAPYATYGSRKLSEYVLDTMGDGNAVLLANHGMVGVGRTLPKAYAVAEMVEYVSQIYLQALSAGNPVILSDEDMEDVLGRFKTYGQQKPSQQDQ